MSMATPSFNHISHGLGFPFAAQSKVTVSPSLTTTDFGFVMNIGAITFDPASKSGSIVRTALLLNLCTPELDALHL